MLHKICFLRGKCVLCCSNKKRLKEIQPLLFFEQMNLRQKLFLILFASTTLFLVALYTFSSSMLLKGYEAIEDRQLNQNTERLQEIIFNEQNSLQTTVNAWSVWDESYKFVLNRNPDFPRVNFLVDSIFDVRFSQVIYFDLKGNILLVQDYNYKERKFLKPNPKRLKDITENFWKIHLEKDPGIPFSGLYSFGDDFEFFTMNPIMKGDGTGSPVGYMLVFREFDSEMVRKFERIIKFKLETSTVNNHTLPGIVISFDKKDTVVIGHMKIPGVFNRNALFIKMTMPRTIYLFGEKTIGKYLGLLSLSSYAAIFILFFIFDKAIIKRIARLKRELNEISTEQATRSKVEVIGNDEISDLAQNINLTLTALDQKQMIINRSSKLTALGEMAASIAHEINSPLSVIGGYATRMSRMLSKGELDEEQLSNAAQKINSNVYRIDKIIKSLRVIARDSEQDEKIPTTLGAVFDDVHSLCQAKLNLRNIKLDLSDLNPHLPLKVRPIQLAQVFVNLINNSIDAIEGQDDAWIKIRAFEQGQETIIQVIDSGETIPDHIAERMMDPFFTTKGAGKGTGLGLSISKGMIEGHSGKLNLSTQPNTCFEIVLPN